jgi:hypothetical protein
VRQRWASALTGGLLAAVLASAGLACGGPKHPSAGGVGHRTVIPAPAPTGIGRSVIPATVPTEVPTMLPAETGLVPDSGPAGTLVTLTGQSFTGFLRVCFGPWTATDVQLSDDGTRLTAIAPAGLGIVQVVVVAASFTSSPVSFTFTSSGTSPGTTPGTASGTPTPTADCLAGSGSTGPSS